MSLNPTYNPGLLIFPFYRLKEVKSQSKYEMGSEDKSVLIHFNADMLTVFTAIKKSKSL